MEKRYPRTVMATACIPWTEDFELDEPVFRQSVRLLLQNGLRSIYLFGTAGEGYAVSREQYTQIVAAFLDEMGRVPGALPMVGVISLSMAEVFERIELALALGARDFQVSFPSWGAVTPDEGMDFLARVCTRYPQARFMHYNNGLRSKTRLSMAHYVQLAARHENLVAVKNPGLGLLELQAFHGEALPIEFFNLEYAYGFASLINPTSLLISVACMNFEHAWAYFRAGGERDVATITACHRDFYAIHQALFRHIPATKIDSVYDKLFTHHHLPAFSQRVYPPYQGATDGQFEAFISELRQTLPHWMA